MPEDKIKELIDFIDDSGELQRPSREMWDEVKMAYNSTEDGWDGDSIGWVKTQKMFTKTREILSTMNLPADFKFRVFPSNPNNDIDLSAAKTAEAHLKYYWRTQKLWKLSKKILLDAILYNRGYARLGFKFKKDNTADTGGANKRVNQPYVEHITPWHFRIQDGFDSIDDAYRTGGRIAIRSDVHIDAVKANEAYNKDVRDKIEADVSSRWQTIDPTESSDTQTYGTFTIADEVNTLSGDSRTLKYVVIWEIFEAPSSKYPKGRYFVLNKKSSGMLFEQDKLPYDGLGFPVREMNFFESQDSYYSKPLAYRALNSLHEMELYETKLMDLAVAIKTILMSNSENMAAQVNDQIDAIRGFGVVDMPNMLQDTPMQEYIFNPITAPLENATLRAEARFDSMFGRDFTSPLQGERIATELRLQNASAIQETNNQKIDVSDFWEDVARDQITLTAKYTSAVEQEKITRQSGMTWQEGQGVTLKGDYNVAIKSSPILDMSMGEEMSVLNQLLQSTIALANNPATADRVDPIEIVKMFYDKMGFNHQDVVKESDMSNPQFENSMLVTGLPVQVRPTDRHIKHLAGHMRYRKQLTDLLEQLPKLAQAPAEQVNIGMDQEAFNIAIQNTDKHIDQHIQIGDRQSEGSTGSGEWKQVKNQVNMQREASAANFSSDGAAQVHNSQGDDR